MKVFALKVYVYTCTHARRAFFAAGFGIVSYIRVLKLTPFNYYVTLHTERQRQIEDRLTLHNIFSEYGKIQEMSGN